MGIKPSYVVRFDDLAHTSTAQEQDQVQWSGPVLKYADWGGPVQSYLEDLVRHMPTFSITKSQHTANDLFWSSRSWGPSDGVYTYQCSGSR
jgi:hypothetical protein